MGHLKDLRAYVEYASRTITCSGVGGRIPADDNGALRDVAVVSICARAACISTVSATTMALCMGGIGHGESTTGPMGRRTKQRPRGFDGCQRT